MLRIFVIGALTGQSLILSTIAKGQDREHEQAPVETGASGTLQPLEAGENELPPVEELDEPGDGDEFGASEGAAAASNPLSSTSKLDLRFDYFDLGSGNDRLDVNLKGDVMLHPRLKLAYEAHYWSTDVTGSTENDWERVSFKPIFFPADVKLDDTWQMRVAAGFEWIIDFSNADKGIGSGGDQIAPLFGLAFNNRESGWTLIPLVQHFTSYEGPDVNTTAFRLIALKPLPASTWLRLDTRIPIDWENSTVPASFEVEYGKMFGPDWGLYVTGFVGIGADRMYDWGIGPAVRVRF